MESVWLSHRRPARIMAFLFATLMACSGDTGNTSDLALSDAFPAAIDEPAQLDRVGTYAHVFPDSPKRVIFLGDSITAGAGASNDDEDYASLLVNNTNAWPEWNGIDLSTRFPEIEVVDVSEGGAWTGTLLNRQLEYLEERLELPIEGETLVVITVGGNDLQSVLLDPSGVDERLEKTVDNWRQIAEYFLDEQRFPDGSTLLMANVYEPTDAVGQVDDCFYGLNISILLPSLHSANTQLRELAESLGFSALDMRGTFLGHGFNHSDPSSPHYYEEDPTLWLANGCTHPNPRGHHEIRALFWRAIDGG